MMGGGCLSGMSDCWIRKCERSGVGPIRDIARQPWPVVFVLKADIPRNKNAPLSGWWGRTSGNVLEGKGAAQRTGILSESA